MSRRMRKLSPAEARAACVMDIERLKAKGYSDSDPEIAWLREQRDQYDRILLCEEMERLKGHYQFNGNDDKERLGADAWLLGK